MAQSVTIRLNLEKKLCRHCGQTIYRFDERERWSHVVPRTPWAYDGSATGHFAAPLEAR